MVGTNKKVNVQFNSDLHIFDNLQEEVIVYEIMRDMLDIVDLRVKYMNNAALINRSVPEDVIGKVITELYDIDVTALHLKTANKVLKCGEGKKYEVFESLDKYYSVSAYSPDNDTYITISTDITEYKRVKEELKRSNAELQRFNYVASHHLQEPLRTIAIFTQLFKRRYKGKLDSDADEFIDYIVEAAIRTKAQIESLLDYSRITTKRVEFKSVNSGSILDQVIANLQYAIKESNAKVTYDSMPIIMANEVQLQKVFQNILSNAIKFKKKEKPLKIHISTIKDEKNKEYIFSVQDNGIGIEKQYNDRIFLMFQRLHTREEYYGTGSGLSIVKRIIECHGGRIWVESEPDVGSTFNFTIPY